MSVVLKQNTIIKLISMSFSATSHFTNSTFCIIMNSFITIIRWGIPLFSYDWKFLIPTDEKHFFPNLNAMLISNSCTCKLICILLKGGNKYSFLFTLSLVYRYFTSTCAVHFEKIYALNLL